MELLNELKQQKQHLVKSIKANKAKNISFNYFLVQYLVIIDKIQTIENQLINL